MSRIREHLTYANVMVTILAFIVLGGGAAYATHLVVNSSDVVDDSLRSVDIRGKPGTSSAPAVDGTLNTHDISGQAPSPGNGTPFVDGTLTQWDVRNGSLVGADVDDDSLRGADVTDDSLRGRDIDESTLGEVPGATIGGLGRWTGSFPQSDFCDPNSTTFIPCATTSLDLPKPSRVLVIGRVQASTGGGDGKRVRHLSHWHHIGPTARFRDADHCPRKGSRQSRPDRQHRSRRDHRRSPGG
jgi:hypothetical protein